MSKTTTANKTARQVKTVNVRYLTMTAMLSAIAFILMFVDFPIPMLIPNFVQMDFSELPALIGAFAMGPVSGVVICLIKNLLHLLVSSTGGVGELSNFILGAAFVLPAGLLYRRKKSKKNAILGSMIGAVIMAVISVISNYFVVYPFYTAFMPMDTIINMYDTIASGFGGHVESLLQCLVIFNMPFTFVKGMCDVLITLLIYKHISPIIKGTSHR